MIIVTSDVGVLEGKDYMSWLTSPTYKEVTPCLTACCGWYLVDVKRDEWLVWNYDVI